MSELPCPWALRSEVEKKYHDKEWGIPTQDERYIFEMLILEGLQAGLSWSIIINKRQSLRQAFDDFDPKILATYDESKIEALMNNPGIIRHELKIKAVIHNAKIYCDLKKDPNWSLSNFLWDYLDYKPVINSYKQVSEIPTQTLMSQEISRDLKQLGFKFVGPTTIYAMMQAIGMHNDHLVSCPFY